MDNPQVTLVFTTNVTEERSPRVAGRLICVMFETWMDSVDSKTLDEMKAEMAELTRY